AGNFKLRCLANASAVAIAMRVGRQIQQDILAHERGDIDVLRAVQFGVERECRNPDFVLELFETGHAAQLNRLRNRSIGPKRAIGNSEVEGVTHWPDAANFRRRDVAERTIFFADEMQTFRRDLVQMDLHWRNLLAFMSLAQRSPLVIRTYLLHPSLPVVRSISIPHY